MINFEDRNESNTNKHRTKSADNSIHKEEEIELQVLKQIHIPSAKLR